MRHFWRGENELLEMLKYVCAEDLCFEQVKDIINILFREREKEIVREVQSTKIKFDHLKDKMDPIDMYRTFHPIAREFIFF